MRNTCLKKEYFHYTQNFTFFYAKKQFLFSIKMSIISIKMKNNYDFTYSS